MANPHPRPFPKTGADANPNGRPPKEWTWSGLIKQKMEELGPDKRAVKEAVAASLLAKALEGDVTAIKEIGNRIEGLPKQFIDLKGQLETFSGADYIGESTSKANTSPDDGSTGQS